ncbi:50S ribosomal protein L9 [Patescibacteria group bacterium]|nr:50S ribosomal protein L9 [Patescibacteria group bacterium]MBU1754885.1 50S ribosomal protein L9 [Patescibacteria group bacterium]
MKVVLLKDVKNMGRAHTVHEVSDGYALNHLIPSKLAVLATDTSKKQAETRVQQVIDRKELDTKLIEQRLSALAEGSISIIKKANEQGHLYDAVDAKEIADATDLPVDAIHLEKPIKELGSFDIPVAVGEAFGKISISIEAE